MISFRRRKWTSGREDGRRREVRRGRFLFFFFFFFFPLFFSSSCKPLGRSLLKSLLFFFASCLSLIFSLSSSFNRPLSAKSSSVEGEKALSPSGLPAMYELRGPPAPPSFGAGPSGYGAPGAGGAPGGPAFRGAGGMGGDSSSFGRARTGGGGGAADAVGKVKDPILRVISWAKSRSPREKAILGGAGALLVSFFFERRWDRFRRRHRFFLFSFFLFASVSSSSLFFEP